MKLTEHFKLEEMLVTGTEHANNPDRQSLANLFYLATYILEPIRNTWGPYIITSGYRSEEVNADPLVRGSVNSQHLTGEACDGYPKDHDIDEVFYWIVRRSGIKFGQAILETSGLKKWIHISTPRLADTNCVALVYEDGNYKPYQG